MGTIVKPFKFLTPNHWFSSPVKVCLIGVGGTGSEMLPSLARINYAIRQLGHPGLHVTAWDGDVVEKTNIGRQAFYPADVGQNKAIIITQRINYMYGNNWDARPEMFDIEQYCNTMNYDLIITCIDVAQFRADLAKKCKSNRFSNCLWLDMGNGVSTGQVILGILGDCLNSKILPSVFDLFPSLDGMLDDNTPSCSMEEALASQDLPINKAIANVGMQLIWSLLRHGGINHQGAFVDVKKGEQIPINIMCDE